MASSGLPEGAFLTTIDGRRCTAVPRAAAATTADADSATQVATANSLSSQTTVNPTKGLVAAPAEDADGNRVIAEPSSTTSTSTTSSPLAITTNIPPSSVQVVQAQENQSGPSLPIPTSLPAALSQASSATLQSFAAFADVTSSQTSVAQSSQADSSVTAPTANAEASSLQTTPSEASSSPVLPNNPAATPLLTTIESPPVLTDTALTDTAVAEATARTSSDPAVAAVPNMNSSAVQSTVAVAGGVIGSVVAVSVIAFFVWWWRRRLLRRRRSTLLTPLDAVPPFFDRDEKAAYVITRGSIGPTPMTEKVKAALGQNFRRIRGHIRNKTAPSVNLDRGTSQFIDMASTHSRANSGIIGAEVTAKDRLQNWWSGVISGLKFNRGQDNQTTKKDNHPPDVSTLQKKAALGSQPDFLTLLSMDGRELDREAQRRRASTSRLNGSAGSGDHFFSVLDIDFGRSSDNPFSDANAIAHTSAKPAPLAVGQPSSNSNPFSDANAIRGPPPPPRAAAMPPKPNIYIGDMRRSRGQSVSATTARQPSTAYYTRDSAGSLGSLVTTTTGNYRNKFRSDPFDLDRPELLGGGAKTSISSSTAATAGSSNNSDAGMEHQQQIPRRPTRAARAESFTSRYTSGVSVASSLGGDWSDPGPDVGPAAGSTAGRWLPGGGDGKKVSPAQAWRERLERERLEQQQQQQGGAKGGAAAGRRVSGTSQGSVGKAM